MRAAVVTRYGPPEAVIVTEVPNPMPRKGDVVLRVEAAAVTSGDARMRGGRFPTGFGPLARLGIGIRGPRKQVLGIAVAGTVESTGTSDHDFPQGVRVAAMIGGELGGHAELARVPASQLALIPEKVSFEDAAGLLFGGGTALQFLRERAHLQPGERVLINGASGAVGSSAVQLAKHLGAHVTAVSSARNRGFALGLGADEHVDYATTSIDDISAQYDLVVDTVGNLSKKSGRRILSPTGRLILAVAGLTDTITARGNVITGPIPERTSDATELLSLAAAGTLDPVTTIAGGLESIRDAYAVVDSGRKIGNLVILPNA
ncbi:alcohol dehydrogenase [Pseudoclavibacter sp. AY1F1]|uniref:NAD(P)-dependent alcohol dehydrogenase n=1 Tax=Pseudoclavibacter sp. AY1F1 TaxID=2080583 RepID=UPI000CE8129A|nr:NAD(P)-dependent alcohol dehydrogenase [Pseudoclavibacter sp. AY1F1]PPF44184.1 alcohol dehydrogenase [Pseudoclavibacter sp. AY1F1]